MKKIDQIKILKIIFGFWQNLWFLIKLIELKIKLKKTQFQYFNFFLQNFFLINFLYFVFLRKAFYKLDQNFSIWAK